MVYSLTHTSTILNVDQLFIVCEYFSNIINLTFSSTTFSIKMDPLDNETCCACLLTTKASTMYWLGDPDTLKLFQDSTNISVS